MFPPKLSAEYTARAMSVMLSLSYISFAVASNAVRRPFIFERSVIAKVVPSGSPLSMQC